jgi:hypothetical protein
VRRKVVNTEGEPRIHKGIRLLRRKFLLSTLRGVH